MRKTSILLTVVAMILCFVTVSFAKDVMITKEVKSITFKTTKTGKPYASIAVSGTATMNGVTYKRDNFIAAFDSDVVAELKSVKKGQTLKMICSEGTYNGNPSLVLLALVK